MMMLGGDLGDQIRLLSGVWDFTLSLDMTITHSRMTPKAIKELIAQRVVEVLANYEETRAANALEAESQSQNDNDGNNGNGGNGNGNHGGGENNGNGNPNENGRGAMPFAHVYTYQDFVKCQPLNFKGTKGVVGLTRWFEKMETLFHINNCLEVYQVKFQELTLLYTRMVPEEEDRIEWQGHFKKDYPKLKNQNHKNKPVIPEARVQSYTIGGGDANPGSNVVTGTFLLNNHYASVLFDSGVDQSFVSTTFSTLLDVIPDTLDVSYAIELADERIAKTNTVLRGCTIGILGHPFNIDLMPVELGSFNVIIGMDWLANNHAMIVCDEKIVRIPFRDEIQIVQGDRSDKGK
ncbi:reverse transcriptase domain-containing protein [Tanacetum coccineum]